MQLPPLYVIVDVEVCGRFAVDPLAAHLACLRGGARCLQLRAKHLASGALLELANACVQSARSYQAIVIINDRADIAALSGAEGVHLGQGDLTAAEARRILGEQAIVGVSTHAPDQLREALERPVSYVAVGPIFGTATKDTGYSPVGLELIRLGADLGVPIVAIGGITLATIGSVLRAGATSAAVISDLFATGDPEARTRELLTAAHSD